MDESSASSGLKTLELNDLKSGMQGLEKDKINSIIYNASKGSRYFYHQQRRQQHIDHQIQQLLFSLEEVTEEQKESARQEMDELAVKLERRRNLTRVIVHIDMDAFYAAVEMRDHPEYKDKPLAVGSSSMLSTSNYIARRFGVRAAMPGFIGKKLCPKLIIVPPDFKKYTQVSNEVRDILAEYDPDFIPMSLDEAYLDITAYLNKKLGIEDVQVDVFEGDEDEEDIFTKDSSSLFDLSDDVVKEMREKIFQKTGLTASAGIAPNMMLAKICSDMNKPNGQFKIEPNVLDIKSFIKSLPVRKVSGIGPVQEQLLHAVGYNTCEDLWEKRELLPLLFSPTSAQFYLRVSLGIGSTRVKCESSRKSKGVEVTFQEISSIDALIEMCLNLCQELANDLQAEKLLGKVVVLKIKTVKFEVKTRHHTLAYYTSRETNIFQAAKALLMTEIAAVKPEPLRLRLMGVRMTGLVDEIPNTSTLKQPTLTELLHKSSDFLNTCATERWHGMMSHNTSTGESSKDQLESSKDGSYDVIYMTENSNDQGCRHTECGEDVSLHKGVCIHKTEDLLDKSVESSVNIFQKSDDNSENVLEAPAVPSDSCISDVEHGETIANSNCIDKELSKGVSLEVGDEGNVLNDSFLSSCSDSTLVCPVCDLCLASWNLTTFNQHIDVCLNRSTVRELVRRSLEVDTKKRKPDVELKKNKRRKWKVQYHKIDDYFK